MNILRLLLLAMIAWLAWRVLRGLWPAAGDPLPPSSNDADVPPDTAKDPTRNFERIRACSRCGAATPQVTLDDQGRCRQCAR